jgi:NADPH:quinone reductase-like Zn-dependent oxidoreductase
MPSNNAAMVMTGPGTPLASEDRPIPQPGTGDALVRVRAVSLNYHDLVNLLGLIQGPWPRVPMTDGAGEVAAVGPDVHGLAVGDRVIGAFHPTWLAGPPTPAAKRECPGDTGDGWLQQYVTFPAAALVRMPAGLSFEEASTLPCAGTTAWSSLREADLRPGDTVVTQGTGGVSILAVQLARAHGATVIATSSSDDKLARARELGADHTINYRTTPDWEQQVRAITGGRGADLVIDVAGQETLGRSIRAVRMGGTVTVTGILSGVGAAEVPVAQVMTRNIRLVGVTTGSVATLDALCRAVDANDLHPQISHVLDWDEVAEGARVMGAGEHVGKVVVRVP